MSVVTSYGALNTHQKRELTEQLKEDIELHYLSNLKYGLEGTDGTMRSNFIAYMANNHPVLSIFCTNENNPNHGFNKGLTFWNSMSLMFFYSCLLMPSRPSFPIACLITVLMMPYMVILDMLSTCRCLSRKSILVSYSHKCGSALLAFLAVFACIFIAAGILVLKVEHRPLNKTIETFFLSVLFSLLLPFISGLSNWFLLSWRGVLCCPQFSCTLGNHSCSTEGYIFCPLLDLFPINFALQMYGMGEQTYIESKKEFEIFYPGRIAVDRLDDQLIDSSENGLLWQSSDSGYIV